MKTDDLVRKQLAALLGGGNAHQRLDQIAADFPETGMNTHPAWSQEYTPWRLLEHIRIAQWDILEFIRNPEYESPPWPEGYWPPEGTRANRAEWQQTLSAIRKDTQDLLDIVHDPHTDLYAPIPHAPDYTIFREILVAADHFSYHLGEFGLLRSALRL